MAVPHDSWPDVRRSGSGAAGSPSIPVQPGQAIWKRKDEEVLCQVDDHPSEITQLQHIYGTRKKTYNGIARLKRKKKIKLAGYINVYDRGRSREMFCNGWKPAEDTLFHEWIVTWLYVWFGCGEWLRGPQVDNDILPDAQWTLGQWDYFIEADTGSQRNWKKVEDRFRKYKGLRDEQAVLWVSLTERRTQQLRERAEVMGEHAFFTTFDAVGANPWGDIWQDIDGNNHGIERE